MSALRKNVTSQHIGFCLNAKADGTPVTAGGAGTVVIDNAAQAACGGTFTHKGTGQWDYAPTQAETNGTSICFAFTGTGAIQVGMQFFTVGYDPTVANLPANLIQVNAHAVTDTANGVLDVNAKNLGGTAQTGRDIGASVLLSAGSGAGQLDFTSGVVKANLAQILGTALTETAGQIAAAFKQWFNVAAPVGTVNSIPNATAGAAGGLFIAGTNAATAITTGLTARIIGTVDTLTTYTGNTPQTGDSFARLGAPAGASVSADIAAIKGDTGTILTDVNTGAGAIYTRIGAPAGASIAADIAAVKTDVDAVPTANANADALLDRANGVEASWTFRQALRVIFAACAGKADGLATTTAHYRDQADTKNRITATVDANGNRTAVALDAS